MDGIFLPPLPFMYLTRQHLRNLQLPCIVIGNPKKKLILSEIKWRIGNFLHLYQCHYFKSGVTKPECLVFEICVFPFSVSIYFYVMDRYLFLFYLHIPHSITTHCMFLIDGYKCSIFHSTTYLPSDMPGCIVLDYYVTMPTFDYFSVQLSLHIYLEVKHLTITF